MHTWGPPCAADLFCSHLGLSVFSPADVAEVRAGGRKSEPGSSASKKKIVICKAMDSPAAAAAAAPAASSAALPGGRKVAVLGGTGATGKVALIRYLIAF